MKETFCLLQKKNPLFEKQCITLRFVIKNEFEEENVNIWS